MMTTTGSKSLTVHRTDLLPSNLSRRKHAAVRELIAAYRAGARMLGREQWRLFFERGRFSKNYDADKTTFAAVIGAAARVQMCRYQVVGVLESWLTNRANEFRQTVLKSSLPRQTKHELAVVNAAKAWFIRADLRMPDSGKIIDTDVRCLARSIMRHVMANHRRPQLARISMRLDRRAATLARPLNASQSGRVGWWVRLSTMRKGCRIDVPLLTHRFHDQRPGRITEGIQINLNSQGHLTFGVITDMSEVCAISRKQYQGRGDLGLDFGLSTLFATSEGQLLGSNWLEQLRRHDERITKIAQGMQKRGLKPRQGRRYRQALLALRGYLKTEIGRILNKLVADGRPATLVLERLRFQNPRLAKKFNRILHNAGRSVVRQKLRDLEQRFGVTCVEIHPAYTSQECSSCGYIDRKNRPSRSTFRCRWCGYSMHADLNAARNIARRRASGLGSVTQGKAALLTALVRQFGERRVYATRTGGRGSTADPRLTNPYFQHATRMSEGLCWNPEMEHAYGPSGSAQGTAFGLPAPP